MDLLEEDPLLHQVHVAPLLAEHLLVHQAVPPLAHLEELPSDLLSVVVHEDHLEQVHEVGEVVLWSY